MIPNRLGLGLRQPLPSYGQGPSMQALAQQQQMQFMQAPKTATLFVGSISGGITDAFLNQLLGVCCTSPFPIFNADLLPRRAVLLNHSSVLLPPRWNLKVLVSRNLKSLVAQFVPLTYWTTLSYLPWKMAVWTRNYWCVLLKPLHPCPPTSNTLGEARWEDSPILGRL